eukprot:6197461-Pleurochrysis_carterae.AAC.4
MSMVHGGWCMDDYVYVHGTVMLSKTTCLIDQSKKSVVVRELARARGLGTPTLVALGGGASGSGSHERRGDPELEERSAERSASTHTARVQNGKLCMRAKTQRRVATVSQIVAPDTYQKVI